MSVDFGIWGAWSDGFVFPYSLLKVFQVAPFLLPPALPLQGPALPSIRLTSSHLLLMGSGFTELRDIPHIFTLPAW